MNYLKNNVLLICCHYVTINYVFIREEIFLIAKTNYVNHKLLEILLNKKKDPKILGGLDQNPSLGYI
jgi:hypothetical protein